MKDCDALVKMEISREDLLDQDANEVDSTTDTESSPVKRPKLAPKVKANASKAAKALKKVSVDTSKAAKGPKVKADASKATQARIKAAKDRAMAIFAAKEDSINIDSDESYSEDDCTSATSSTTELERKLAQQNQQIEELLQQLGRKQCMLCACICICI